MPGSQANTTARRNAVADMILRGFPSGEIYRRLVKSGLTIAPGTVYNDVCAVKKQWAEHLEENKAGNAAADFLQRAFDLRDKAEAGGDLKLAYAITKDIANLLGVTLAERHEVEQIGDVEIEVVWRNGRKP